jgi:hypothetical protein
LCKVRLDTYHGAFVMDRSILDWALCIVAMLVLLEQPQSSMPYVHIGLMTVQLVKKLKQHKLLVRSLHEGRRFFLLLLQGLQSASNKPSKNVFHSCQNIGIS